MTYIGPAPLRILVVEDETVLAMAVEGFLQDLGHEVVGPFARVTDALSVVEGEILDAALLDVNLAGEMVFPVAAALALKGVPFLLVSGYDDRMLRRGNPDWPHLTKPYRIEEALSRLCEMTRCAPGHLN